MQWFHPGQQRSVAERKTATDPGVLLCGWRYRFLGPCNDVEGVGIPRGWTTGLSWWRFVEAGWFWLWWSVGIIWLWRPLGFFSRWVVGVVSCTGWIILRSPGGREGLLTGFWIYAAYRRGGITYTGDVATGFGDASVSAVDVTSGPEVDFLDTPPPCCRGPAELRTLVRQTYCDPVKDLQLGVWRISDVREYPGVSYESSSMVVACTMVTDIKAPETVVLITCGSLIVQEPLFECPMYLGRKSLGPGWGWSASTGGVWWLFLVTVALYVFEWCLWWENNWMRSEVVSAANII